MDMAAVKRVVTGLPAKIGRTRLAVTAGLLVILLILASEYAPSRKTDSGVTESPPQFDSAEYAAGLERRLEELIGSVDGAGRTKVMVTLKNSSEYVYASSDKSSIDTNQSTGASGQHSSGSRENTESSFIIIEDKNGRHALVRTELAPTVSGVVVVCDGAGDEAVKARVEEVVTTALGISPKRVCITLLSQEDKK